MFAAGALSIHSPASRRRCRGSAQLHHRGGRSCGRKGGDGSTGGKRGRRTESPHLVWWLISTAQVRSDGQQGLWGWTAFHLPSTPGTLNRRTAAASRPFLSQSRARLTVRALVASRLTEPARQRPSPAAARCSPPEWFRAFASQQALVSPARCRWLCAAARPRGRVLQQAVIRLSIEVMAARISPRAHANFRCPRS